MRASTSRIQLAHKSLSRSGAAHELRAAGTCAQVHQFDFCAAGGASGEANNEAVLNLAGVRPGHLLMAEWNNSVGRPCHYVAADLANGCLVLAIRCRVAPACCTSWASQAHPHCIKPFGSRSRVPRRGMHTCTGFYCGGRSRARTPQRWQ
jgi:hypothetical protein